MSKAPAAGSTSNVQFPTFNFQRSTSNVQLPMAATPVVHAPLFNHTGALLAPEHLLDKSATVLLCSRAIKGCIPPLMSAPRHSIFIGYRRADSVYAVDQLDEARGRSKKDDINIVSLIGQGG